MTDVPFKGKEKRGRLGCRLLHQKASVSRGCVGGKNKPALQSTAGTFGGQSGPFCLCACTSGKAPRQDSQHACLRQPSRESQPLGGLLAGFAAGEGGAQRCATRIITGWQGGRVQGIRQPRAKGDFQGMRVISQRSEGEPPISTQQKDVGKFTSVASQRINWRLQEKVPDCTTLSWRRQLSGRCLRVWGVEVSGGDLSGGAPIHLC